MILISRSFTIEQWKSNVHTPVVTVESSKYNREKSDVRVVGMAFGRCRTSKPRSGVPRECCAARTPRSAVA